MSTAPPAKAAAHVLHSLGREITLRRTRERTQLLTRVSDLCANDIRLGKEVGGVISRFRQRGGRHFATHCGTFILRHSGSCCVVINLTLSISLLTVVLCAVVRQSLGHHLQCRERLRRSSEEGQRLLHSHGRLVTSITRSLHTPLTTIGNYTRLLPSRDSIDHEANCLSGVLRSSSCVLNLMGALVRCRQVSRNKIHSGSALFDLGILFRRVTSNRQLTTERGGLVFAMSFSNLSAVIYYSNSRVQRVTSGLLSGTLGFAPRKRIHLRTRCLCKRLYVSIQSANIKVDTRRGRQVFKTFRELSGTHNVPKFKLKLTVATQLISRVQNHIRMGDIPNRNDHFSIFLPIPSTKRSTPLRRGIFPTYRPPNNVHILIVSSSHVRLRVAQRVLSHDQVRYSYYASIQRLVSYLGERRCSLLLASVRVPNTSNFSILRLLESSGVPQTERVPTVTIATRSNERRRCLSTNFTKYVRGPFSTRELMATVVKTWGKVKGDKNQASPSYLPREAANEGY